MLGYQEKEILQAFKKIHNIIDLFDKKMQENLTNQEKTFMVSLSRLIPNMLRDIKSLKEKYLQSIKTYNVNENIVKFTQENADLKKQLDDFIAENSLLKKIMRNYQKNTGKIQEDRDFEKKFTLETQRENKYLKIALEELQETHAKPEEKPEKHEEFPLKIDGSLGFKESFQLLLAKREISEEKKLDCFKEIYNRLENAHFSEIRTYKTEVASLKSKVISLTRTNKEIFAKLNEKSRIPRLFEECVELLQKKLAKKRESARSSLTIPSSLQTSAGNKSKLEEILGGIAMEQLHSFEKTELIANFLTNEQFLQVLKDLVREKKCCFHEDCYFNKKNTNLVNESEENRFKSMKFDSFFKDLNRNSDKNKNLLPKKHSSTHVFSRNQAKEQQNYLNITNRESFNGESFAEKENNMHCSNSYRDKSAEFLEKKTRSSFVLRAKKQNIASNSLDLANSQENPAFLFFRKRHLKKKTDFN